MSIEAQTEGKRVYILSHPRTRCNLLFRLLSSHPSLAATTPLRFLAAYYTGSEYQTPERSKQMNDGQCSHQTYQEVFDVVRKSVEDIEVAGKIPLVMDHPMYFMSHTTMDSDAKFPSPRKSPLVERPVITFNGAASWEIESNPTCLPDTFLYSFIPVITIRHPARVLGSYVRAMYDSNIASFALDENQRVVVMCNLERAARLKWERLVFDSFKEKHRIVVDGDRLAQDPQGQTRALCEALGIDADEGKIGFTWHASSSESINESGRMAGHHDHLSTNVKAAFFGSFNKSNGVIADKRVDDPVIIVNEKHQWVEEWGQDLAAQMEDMVLGAMEDYEYLCRFAI